MLVIPLECTNIELAPNCVECNAVIDTNDPFYYDQEENAVYCEECEKNLQKGKTFRIYIKSNNIGNEIVNEFYNKNVYINEPIDKTVDDICDLCEEQMKDKFYLSMTQLNTVVGFVHFCICDDCFDNLRKAKKIKKGKCAENIKRFCIDNSNLIFRKISY